MDLNFRRSQNRSDQPLGGRYKIVENLGVGGFGQTFRAQDLHLPGHPLCVVKQLNPQVDNAEGLQVARRLFDTEAKVLYQLGSHPQIPHLLAHFEENKEFYLAQELIEGHSLADEFEITPWDVPKVIDFLGDVLKTLAFVHEHRVIHRDLKPSNLIRRNQDNCIVVIDFGAVKQAGTQPAGGISHTISIGTHGYMPSEQLAGQPQFSSDVYAVGVMGIQALTGQLPKYLTPHAQTGELDWHSYARHLHPDLVGVLDTMVRYDFRTRYPSAKEALNALQALPKELEQYSPAMPVSVETEPAPPVPEPTGLTVPAMAQSPPTAVAAGARAPMATEVVSLPSVESTPSPRRQLPIPAIIIGTLFLATGLLIGRACSPISPNQPAVTATDTDTIPDRIPAPATDPEPTPQPEDKGTALTPAIAQTVIDDFYKYISRKSWDQAKSQTSDTVAQQFNPDFFEQFQQVSVENLQVTAQTPEYIEFLGQNTYVYNDGSTQTEERTFIVQLVDGSPRIVDSAFKRVTKFR
ncbi:serine/threonine-protein kinase [Leptothoe spongobia]|uniref:non-specific serine/threonine protein kinase n=1 Tax=Leptothoe spongobia TAU-MAC 1115 TaxID=1967444 RepID=A0A947GLW7_9CYAN|nr:serine/threonine-protein kinase [Leptothoe spongobia]MBT9317608.1 protein kinase [Leptothoe spongobia TAU-MAC 1115]